MSADIIEPVSSTDIVRRVSEVYLTDSHEKFKNHAFNPALNVPKLIPLQLSLSMSCIRKFFFGRYGINFERANMIVELLIFAGLILIPYKMWIGSPIKELSHLTIFSAIESV